MIRILDPDPKKPNPRSDPSDLWDPPDPIGSQIYGIRGSWDPTITAQNVQDQALLEALAQNVQD